MNRLIGWESEQDFFSKLMGTRKSAFVAVYGRRLDLLFDRADQTISVCEIKFSQKPYVVDKNFVLAWERRRNLLTRYLKTNKQMAPVLVTPFGVKKSAWLDEINLTVVTLSDLIKPT